MAETLLEQPPNVAPPLHRGFRRASLGVCLRYGLLHDAAFYTAKHVLLLSRMTPGEVGNTLLEKTREVLRCEALELAKSLKIHLPDEAHAPRGPGDCRGELAASGRTLRAA